MKILDIITSRILLLAGIILCVTHSLTAQNVYNRIPNYSFEFGTSEKPDDYAQLNECNYWVSYWSADWYTTYEYGNDNHYENRSIDDLSGHIWQNHDVLLDPYNGEMMAGIGNCEGFFIDLQESGIESGCSYNLSFMLHPRSFPDMTNSSQLNHSWEDEINILFLSGAPDPGSNPCLNSFSGLVQESYSFTFERGTDAGVLIDEFTPGVWKNIEITNIIFNEDMKYLFVRLPPNGSEGYGINNDLYYYFDNFILSSVNTESYLETYYEIDLPEELLESSYEACDYIEISALYNSSNDPLSVDAPKQFKAKNEIVIEGITEVNATSEQDVVFSVEHCMNCPSEANIFYAEDQLCFCSTGEAEEGMFEYDVYPNPLLLNPPVQQQTGNSYSWVSANTNVTLYTNQGNAYASFPSPFSTTTCCLYFDFYYNEYDQNNNLVNSYILRYYGGNECTESQREIAGAPESCNSSSGKMGSNETTSSKAAEYQLAVKEQEEKNAKNAFVSSDVVVYTDPELNTDTSNDEDEYVVEDYEQLGYRVFPNPASSDLSIVWSEDIDGELQVYDLRGQLLLTKSIQNRTSIELDISSLSRATYILYIKDDNGVIKYAKRVVKE